MRTQLGEARHQVGALQGRLEAVEASRVADTLEINTLRRQLSAALVPAAEATTKPHRETRGGAAHAASRQGIGGVKLCDRRGS
ncbi:hypothetical protein [Burkholderia sp. SCN-KJ]|uniref:hypothetical protein n=1 Tax=Burkholderia sp. SCN-KJ TaxID=2969248 RepID=UPI0021502798|nr:hypothetical protein [Burkholderia sp. SCN-KJ]MCR4470041.1 hypothetical protein [Burkholderia sp. SCN-KJ]